MMKGNQTTSVFLVDCTNELQDVMRPPSPSSFWGRFLYPSDVVLESSLRTRQSDDKNPQG